MLKILLFFALGMLATVPSAAAAAVYLRATGQPAPMDEVVPRFMAVAPLPLKITLVGLNFALFGLIALGLWLWSRS